MWHGWDNASCPAQKWTFPQYPATPQYAQVRFVYVSSCWVIYSPHFSTEALQSAPQSDQAEEPTWGCTPHFCPPSLDRSVQGNPLTREGARSEHSVAWVAPASLCFSPTPQVCSMPYILEGCTRWWIAWKRLPECDQNIGNKILATIVNVQDQSLKDSQRMLSNIA